MTGKTILITRGVGDGEELREQLQQLGHRVIHEPLTEIFLNHTARPQLQQIILSDPDGIIATSRYGIRALAALDETRDAAILCVGESTAEVAESVGYSRVTTAGQDAQDLVDYIADAYDHGSRFLYVSAAHIRSDLEELLKNYGMEVTRLVVYEAVASEALSDTLVEQLKRNQVDAVTFLSERSATIFMDLLAKADALEATESLEAYCLSNVIADALQDASWRQIFISDEPTLASLIASVDNAAA